MRPSLERQAGPRGWWFCALGRLAAVAETGAARPVQFDDRYPLVVVDEGSSDTGPACPANDIAAAAAGDVSSRNYCHRWQWRRKERDHRRAQCNKIA
jgi:hypothetical protein